MLSNIIMSLPRLRLRLRNSSRRCAAAAWAATALARALALAAAARAAALAAAARAAAALAAARCRCSSFLRHFVPFDRDPCCFFLYLAVCFCPWASTMFETVHLQHVWETPFFLILFYKQLLAKWHARRPTGMHVCMSFFPKDPLVLQERANLLSVLQILRTFGAAAHTVQRPLSKRADIRP